MDQSTRPKPKRRQLLAPQFVQAMLAGHSALGLAFAALLYVVCLTGSLCVFLPELQRWEQPGAPVLDAPVSAEKVGAAVKNAYTQAIADNAQHDIFLMGPDRAWSRFYVNYHDHETGADGQWLADAEGRLITRVATPWANFLGALHMQLHLPRTWGLFLVGLAGVALLSSLISGLLAHPRIFKDAFALRWGGSRRLQDADLHNRLGVWGMPFHVVVSLSGALLGLSTLIVGVLALAAYDGDSEAAFSSILGPRASADETAAPVPDVAAMIRHVQAAKPGAVFANVHIDHVGKTGQVVHLTMRTPGHLATGNSYYFKGDGLPLGDAGLEEGSIGQRILGVLQPLHFGWFGGYAVKFAYAVLGLALTIVSYTGVTIWLARRRDKGRPAANLEKIWAGVGWGQPAAIAVAGIAGFYAGELAILPAYLIATVASIAAALLMPSGKMVAYTLRALSALAVLGLTAAHGHVWRAYYTDVFVWVVDAVLISIAFALIAPVIARPAKRMARA